MASLALLLDEHYPASVGTHLASHGIDVDCVIVREDLRGQPDATVLSVATREGRIVVTEDVTTFPAAMATVPQHVGVVFCEAERFPRTASALPRLEAALLAFWRDPPDAVHYPGFVWWLAEA